MFEVVLCGIWMVDILSIGIDMLFVGVMCCSFIIECYFVDFDMCL